MIKLGYKASAEQFGPNELLEYAVLAEELGLDSVWISDHFQPWRHTGGHAPFSLAWLGALGARTGKIVMGTSVLTPTYRYHPSVVAQAFATLGTMFPGRVVLGMGTGESLNEVPASGLEWPEQKERTARFREALRLIRTLWSEERVSFEGQYYHTKLATIYDRPREPVPIYIAGAGPFMAKLAGMEGDGFICTSGKKWELYTRDVAAERAGGARRIGPRAGGSGFERMIEMKVSFDSDRERALARHALLGRAGAAAGGEGERRGSAGDGEVWRTRCRSSEPPRAGSCRATRTKWSRRSAPTCDWDSIIWCSMPPAPTRRDFSSCSPSRWRRVCGARSVELAERPRSAVN